ncbi:MAG: hypothetical protein H6Q73_175 [Firmicutes bacterium]|nr:hypothetical protein [Bacillota bacterium]
MREISTKDKLRLGQAIWDVFGDNGNCPLFDDCPDCPLDKVCQMAIDIEGDSK